jgi:hypothetical protein
MRSYSLELFEHGEVSTKLFVARKEGFMSALLFRMYSDRNFPSQHAAGLINAVDARKHSRSDLPTKRNPTFLP